VTVPGGVDPVAHRSAIEWTETTWNPVTGCNRVSAGCDHCYAATLAGRLKRMGNPRYQNDGLDGPGFALTMHADLVELPHRWRRPRMVFVNSMSDLFHPDVPIDFIVRVFAVMESVPRHTFQVLTKRPGRAAYLAPLLPWPNNVWMGTSVESDQVLFRVDRLRQVPAAVRFLSCEPLLGPLGRLDLLNIHWVIAGGESGPSYRPVDPEWVRQLRNQCLEEDVSFFFKQWGGRTPKAGGRQLDGRAWDQMPRSLHHAGAVSRTTSP
jgi:protein gp37